MNNGNYRRKTENNVNSNNPQLNQNNQNFNFNDDNVEMSNEEYFQYEKMGRRNSDNINSRMNDNTLINVDGGQPMGLDLNKFMNYVDADQTVHSISQSNDLPIISEVNYFN
jgi:hypothetical protein